MSAVLDQLYGGTLRQGEQPHPWDFLQESNARILELSIAEVLAADDRHRRNLVAASQLRQERQKLVQALEGRIRNLRRCFAGHHGADALALVGLEAPPADSLAGLTLQVQDVLRRLRDPVLELPPPRPGLTFSPESGIIVRMYQQACRGRCGPGLRQAGNEEMRTS